MRHADAANNPGCEAIRVLRLLVQDGPQSTREAAEALALPADAVIDRMRDHEQAGRVVRTGTRPTGQRGRPPLVWKATESGISWLDSPSYHRHQPPPNRELLAAANAGRLLTAGARDARTARDLLERWPGMALMPEDYRAAARARAARPHASWAQLGKELGWSKDRTTGIWRRLMKASAAQH